ncbi:hypothetical protein N7453_000024 [Penicillium expansum]|nr:hypothetical protein N7453_000024 [Penicillium expansum]
MGPALRTQTHPLLHMNKLLAGHAIRPLTEGHTVVLQEISTPVTGNLGIEPRSILTDHARLCVQGITT